MNFLGQIPTDALFYVQHQLRHPESTYAMSLRKIGDAFSLVAEGYLRKTQDYAAGVPKVMDVSDLLKDQENLLRALQEHLDDCWLVLKTLIDPATATRTPLFADKYVLENRLPGARTFRDATADYKNTLRIANKLKHQQGRLRGVALWVPNRPSLGYFLEAPGADGSIGPSPEVHPDQGAFSFARDLTWHLFNVYAVSEKLVSAVDSALSAQGKSLSRKVMARDKEWERAISLAARLPIACFPKEVPKHIADFDCDEIGGVLSIEFPKNVRLAFPSPIQTTCSTVGDGHSRQFKVPFP